MSSMPVIVELNKRIQYSKDRQFTGILSIQAGNTVPWHLYFLAGQIVWASTKAHSQRRWRRQLLKYCPGLIQQHQNSEQLLSYNSLAKSVMRKKFDRVHFSKLVVGCVLEILFDIIQQGTLNFKTSRTLLTYKISHREAAKFPCVGIQNVQLWKQVQQEWQTWEQCNLIEILPNQVPLIVKPQKLRENTSPTVFRALTGLVDGQQTLRDLALRTRQPLVPLTVSLLPHIQNNLICMMDTSTVEAAPIAGSPSLAKVPDVATAVPSSPVAVKVKHSPTLTQLLPKSSPRDATILYIDDSPADSERMGEIIQAAGYVYVNIADSLQALPQLLEIKPQLIFLDLVMPVANGYEICAQIRRISTFKKTPVVIVTNNDGIADRVRAKVVGASGFMGKPIQKQKVLKVLKNFLPNHRDAPTQLRGHSELSPSV